MRRNGSGEHVLPNCLNVEFEGCAGDVLLQALDLEGVAASAGAACHSGAISPSHVLTAMGRTRDQARGSHSFPSTSSLHGSGSSTRRASGPPKNDSAKMRATRRADPA